MSPMYMVPHRPMFAAGQTAMPAAHPGYLPMATAAATAPHQQIVMPELTVKTSTSQPTAHASTSPNKPMSAASSPKVVSVLCMLIIITSLCLCSVTSSCFSFLSVMKKWEVTVLETVYFVLTKVFSVFAVGLDRTRSASNQNIFVGPSYFLS